MGVQSIQIFDKIKQFDLHSQHFAHRDFWTTNWTHFHCREDFVHFGFDQQQVVDVHIVLEQVVETFVKLLLNNNGFVNFVVEHVAVQFLDQLWEKVHQWH